MTCESEIRQNIFAHPYARHTEICFEKRNCWLVDASDCNASSIALHSYSGAYKRVNCCPKQMGPIFQINDLVCIVLSCMHIFILTAL